MTYGNQSRPASLTFSSSLLHRSLRARSGRRASVLTLALLGLSGCTNDHLAPQPELPSDQVPSGSKTHALETARPLETGLLSVSPDGAFAAASDDQGPAVHVVALTAQALTSRAVALEPGEFPGRSALTNTHAYVLLPDSGALAVIDLASASIVERWNPCPSPQGVAVEGESLHVACRGGELVTFSLADGSVVRSLLLDEDLRDVAVVQSGLVVSRLAKAELIWLDPEGIEVDRSVPTVSPGNEAAVAWRIVVAPSGAVYMAHQTDTDQSLGGGYSGGECGSITAPTVTAFVPPGVSIPAGSTTETSAEAQQLTQLSLMTAAGTFDLAVNETTITLVFPGNEFARRFMQETGSQSDGILPALGEVFAIHTFTIGVDDNMPCSFTSSSTQHEESAPIGIVAVEAGAFSGASLVLTHSPAEVKVLDGDVFGSEVQVALDLEERRDTGLELFQMTVGTGVSCSSCHPGGRADARTWLLANGPRRTQPLEGGVSHLGAFHWDAEFDTFDALVDDVMSDRMGLHQELSSAHKSVLLSFLDAIPPAARPAQSLDFEATERGRLLFESPSTECSTCHGGAAFTNNTAVDVGTGGVFVTPSLVGVGYREPLMHDGCASDLLDRFGPCGGGDRHGKTSHLTDAEVGDLVTYMKSL